MKNWYNIILKSSLCFLLGFALMAGAVFALTPKTSHANLTISPLRIIFEGRQRAAEVMLLNLSQEENTYRVGWIYNKMNETGQYERVEESLTPGHDTADFVLFSPRQVTIPPSGRQKVRLSLRRPPDLPDGEYRAHMIFQKLPKEGGEPSIGTPEKGMRISMNVVLGFSIPVIVRQGEYDAQITMSNPRFIPVPEAKGDKPRLELELNRTGKHSTLGRVIVTWDQATNPGKRIGILNNVSIFPEMKKRIIRIQLNENSIPSGNLTVSYVGDGPQRGIIFSEMAIPVGQ